MLRHAVFMVLAAQDTHVAVPSVLIVLLIGGVIYSFGYVRAVMHRANRDYKTTKAAVPNLRRAFWRAWLDALKFGVIGAVILMVLGVWAWREMRGNQNEVGNSKPSPSPSSHAPSHKPARHSNR